MLPVGCVAGHESLSEILGTELESKVCAVSGWRIGS